MRNPIDPELQKIIDAENERNRAERRRIAWRLVEARKEAERLAEALGRADPNVRKVILFGSVAAGTARSEGFDIDLGLLGGDQLALMSITEESSFRVDLVDLQAVSSRFRELVEQRGEELYHA